MADTLTKTDNVESVHDQLGFQKNDSADIVEILLEIIKESLELGEDVLTSGFGKFQVRKRGAAEAATPPPARI